jgi:predicted RND superfamily exporter protein
MQSLAKFLVNKRIILFTVSVALAILFSFFINSVTLNKDDTKYLDPESGMAQGLSIMESEFPLTTMNDSFQIMFEGLTRSEKISMVEQLTEFEGVESITFDPDSPEHNSKTYTMYIVNTKYVKNYDKVKVIMNEMTNSFKDQHYVETFYGGTNVGVLDLLIPMACVVGLIMLFAMTKAYIEPLFILISIAIAVLINMGSNIIFESVSEMTFSIAAVLQLVLSIDYSIMLIHRFEQEYELLEVKDAAVAMQNAIIGSFSSIVTSSITTIVGLLVLLLMSFTIGTDIGLVLSKGVFLSLVCVFTVMPTIIIWGHKLLFATNKNNLRQRRLNAGGVKNV